MTDREYDLWKAVFMAEYSKCEAENAALLADFAVEELRKRMAHAGPAQDPDPVIGETNPLRLYPWAKLNEYGCVIDIRTGTYPVTADDPGVWTAWVTPDCDSTVICTSLDEAYRKVDWQKWDRRNSR